MNIYKNAPRLDATNIAGITTLMNQQHVKNNIDLLQIENSIMKKEKKINSQIDEFDPVKYYTSEINKLAEELGVDLISSTEDKIEPTAYVVVPDIPTSEPEYIPDKKIVRIDNINLDVESENSSSDSDTKSKTSKSSRISKSSKASKSSRLSKHIDVDNFISSLDEQVGIDLSSEKYKRRYDIPDMKYKKPVSDSGKSFVDGVISDMHNETKTTRGVEREKIQDIKLSKIEQISQLRMTLEEEGINCNNIKQPTLDTTLEEIDSILNILRLKNDRNRYSTLAEELILGMAEGIETVFDGSRNVPFLNWTPDYRGYHSTVNIKLHRMRFETSQVVGSVIEKYNISPSMRIIMELLPSFFLYPRQQSKQRSTPGLHSDPKVGDARMAYASIKEMEDKQKEEMVNI